MVEERTQRRLTAILAADVVGYSRLMERDEAGTLAALKSRRKGILQPLLAKYFGRIVKLMGDGVLVEFASAVNAVQCAVELQEAMEVANGDLPQDSRIVLRVGINLGDVVVEGNDLYGDGVNIAARLESLADPGRVFVSRTVFNHVRGKVKLEFEDLGEQHLKNIAEPVRIYRLRPDGDSSIGRSGLALPEKPSIAVLPFTNMSGDPEQEYFSDGITEDIITELSRFRSLFVIARNSSFAFKAKAMKVQEIARDLGVAYVVEGSVRRATNRVRITAQLIDASTGNHLWAERFDRDMRDIFALQDEVAQSVASTVSGRVEAVGRDRAVHLSPTALKAYDLILRAKALISNYTKADNEQALACARRAVELDPASARAHAHAAWCHFFNYMACWTADRANAFARAFELAQRAVVLDETDSFAHSILGLIHLMRREYDEARSEIEKAVDLNPNDPEVRRYYGDILAATGKPDAAIDQIDLGRRLNPFDTRWVPWIKGMACFTAHRYDEAIASLRQARDPINEVRGWLAASYAHAGRLEEARATLEEFLRVAETDMAVFPGRRLKDWEAYWHGAFEYQDQKDFDHLFDALRKAGMQN
jgi:TolB-like protein/class 3 adenylate cyclase/Flp pilus assembly protein TadD